MVKLSKKTKSGHPTHQEELVRLRRIKGQVEGIERMIKDQRYCLDIVTQIRSIISALRSTEGVVMERHLRHCVSDAVSAQNERLTQEKIQELIALFQKR